jgi:hypothetical protein
VTVIDVTEPESPAYCFVSVTGTESAKKLPLCVPLSAEDYLRAYYPLPTPTEMEDTNIQQSEKYNVEAIAALDGEKMVTLEMLADAWPDEYKNNLDISLMRSPPPLPTPVTPTIPSLSDLAVLPSVKAALETGETTTLEDILWMPAKMTQIQSTLREITPFPDSGIALLMKIITQEMKSGGPTVNLSGYALSDSQVIKIASSFKDEIKTLNLSYNEDVTVDTVRQVIMSCSLLKRLVLLGCTAITDDDVKEMLTSEPKLFYKLEAFIHPFLLKDKASYPNAFSYIGVMGDHNMITSCSLAYFSPPSIVQALTDLLPSFGTPDSRYNGASSSCFVPLAAFCAAKDRPSGQKWGERSVVAFPQTSLGALQGEGWAFVLYSDTYATRRNLWGFVRRMSDESEDGWMPPKLDHMTRLDPESNVSSADGPPPPFEVLDLRSFLARMAEEGRPLVPEEAIEKLEGILKKVEEVAEAHLATREDMALIIGNANFLMQRSYYYIH